MTHRQRFEIYKQGRRDWPSSPPLTHAACILSLLFTFPALEAADAVTNTSSRPDYSAFRIIAERNIFNTNRSARVSRSSRPVERPKTVESFSLVGTMSYEKGSFAFFEGTSSAYKKVGSIQDRIAGFTIQEIRPEGVMLKDHTNQFDLTVGMRMQREDDAPWQLMASSEVPPPSARSEETSSSSTSSSDSSVSEILRRLKEKREKELK